MLPSNHTNKIKNKLLMTTRHIFRRLQEQEQEHRHPNQIVKLPFLFY
jgi:hypothetical protein